MIYIFIYIFFGGGSLMVKYSLTENTKIIGNGITLFQIKAEIDYLFFQYSRQDLLS